MTRTFRLPAADFAALASGYGGAPVVGLLRAAQVSKHLLLTRCVVRAHRQDVSLARAVEVLAAAQRRAPDVAADVLARAWTGAWAAAARCGLSPLSGDGGPAVKEVARAGFGDPGYASAVAAVAALRTGLDVEVDLPVAGGRVVLPTLGVALAAAPGSGRARAVVRGGSMVIHHDRGRVVVPAEPATEGDGWLGMRRFDVACGGRRLDARLDDLDPYRDCYRIPVAPRLPAEELSRWRDLFQGAWRVLVRHLPDRAEELSAGLHAVVPLAEGDSDPGLSATSRDSFGAFALNRPRSAAALAATLVHEFQHSKLNGVLDLVPLYAKRGKALYHAPWRTDPRPIGAALHGAYAFLGVADFWRSVGRAPVGAGDNDARAIYAEVREQVWYVLSELAGSDELTPAGGRFVAGMRAALGAMPVAGVPPAVRARARHSVLASRVAWRLRHRRPDAGQVSALCTTFLATAGATGGVDGATAGVDRATAGADGPRCPAGTGSAAPDEEAWGERLAGHESGPVFDRPELVVALYREIRARSCAAPDVPRLIEWLNRTLGR